MKYFALLFISLFVFSCSQKADKKETSQQKPEPYWQAQESGVNAGLRGLSAVSDQVAWASGSGGTAIRTTDGGATWQNVSIPGTDTLQFRDIEAFDANTAIVLSAGLPAVIYKTTDGGQNWEQKYFSMVEGTFYDAMDFWNEKEGIAFGDAINGRLLILKTTDGGETWNELPFEQRPQALEGQGGFAASGTCLRTVGENQVYIGLGGQEASLFYSFDKGETWQKTVTPIQSGEPTEGIFSIDFKNEMEGLMVGGDYRGDSLTKINAAYTTDGGKSWFPVMAGMKPKGYRSGVALWKNYVFAVGRESCDYYREGDKAYTLMEGQYYAVDVSLDGEAVWASGPGGAVGKLDFNYIE
ncbi:YCF48-related protein [Roseivirga sp. UBA1976]|uniref:WD40/YVTN/BNR-like repeat-containing protein n=1 Tax=Roseivirga sp. UBA1976 TaxID=1947386 RepID=UPI0025802D26|nr:YCF48-related protein [Roseivirga sp. UBA1976]MEC7755182.1 YCF48-related protein [Bacteroidota bacterium]|tara:strand:+ start:1731 stop:2792 length:1062 start_codon:yes stop_codon:yes gene_type:complete